MQGPRLAARALAHAVGHKNPSVHLRMLEMAHKHNFRFDTVQMPINVMDAHFRSFEKEVAPMLVQKQSRLRY